MSKLIDKQNRRTLGEGRNYGMGMACLKKDGDNFETVCPITACKDFISDVIYSELTGKPYYAYGLSTSKKDIFDYKNDEAYFVFAILNMLDY